MEHEVSLVDVEILDAREGRVQRQQALLARYGLPIVSFTRNIAGPIKNGAGIRRAFCAGRERLEAALRGENIAVIAQESNDEPTGCEGLFVLRGGGRRIKEIRIALEDADALGRLFDLDVLDPAHGKWDRTALGHPACLPADRALAARRLSALMRR